MRTHDPEDESHEPVAGHRSELSGQAADVVQARDVHGGVHFHGVGPTEQPIPWQLPGDVRGFVNRLDELARLDDVLAGQSDEPLVVGLFVITGTAGVGKTSLALHWAHSVRRRFPGGQLYVNLRGYDPGPPVSPERALDRFLRALGVQPASMPVELEDRAALYRSLLADRRMLIVLDNAATVRQVRPLLPGNSECLVLVTSRSRLSGLVARDGARRLSLDVLTEREAIDLLRVITAGYRSHDDPADVLELARLCARLPLALRIAAERASSRPLMLLTELIADLRDESALWSALTAEDDEEADAVRTVFAWSYRALPEAVARLFRLLGLHPGPEFGLPAAAALTGTSTSQVKQLLDVLVGAHMLEQHAPGRYQFHDLLRAYAADQATERESPMIGGRRCTACSSGTCTRLTRRSASLRLGSGGLSPILRMSPSVRSPSSIPTRRFDGTRWSTRIWWPPRELLPKRDCIRWPGASRPHWRASMSSRIRSKNGSPPG